MDLRRYQVTSFGLSLVDGLRRPGLWGKVVATFRHSFYVFGPEYRVMCVVDRHLGDGPINLCVDFPHSWNVEKLGIKTGMSLRCEEQALMLGNAIQLRISGATVWSPQKFDKLATGKAILVRLRSLVENLRKDIPDSGLASLLLFAEDLAKGNMVNLNCKNKVVYSALPGLTSLIDGICRRDEFDIDTAVGHVIGLGPGLTPSGDDFLGGMMVGLNAFFRRNHVAGKGSVTAAERDCWSLLDTVGTCVLRHSNDGTVAISAALLRQAAAGNSSIATHRVVQDLIAQNAPVDLVGNASAMVRFGNTSGWDCLSGVIVGIHLALRVREMALANIRSLEGEKMTVYNGRLV